MVFNNDWVEVPANLAGALEYALLWAFAITYKVVVVWAVSTGLLMVAALGVAYLWAGVSGDRSVIQAWPKAVGRTSAKLAGGILICGWRQFVSLTRTVILPALRHVGRWAWRQLCTFAGWLRRVIPVLLRRAVQTVRAWAASFNRWLNHGHP